RTLTIARGQQGGGTLDRGVASRGTTICQVGLERDRGVLVLLLIGLRLAEQEQCSQPIRRTLQRGKRRLERSQRFAGAVLGFEKAPQRQPACPGRRPIRRIGQRPILGLGRRVVAVALSRGGGG